MERFIVEFALRATLIAASAVVVLRVLRITTAAAQHAVWTGVLVVMLALPAWISWGPKAALPLLPARGGPAALMSASSAAIVDSASDAPVRTGVSASVPRASGGTKSRDLIWVGVYLFGAGVLMLRLAIGTIRANRLTSTSCLVPVTVGLLRPRIVLPECRDTWPEAQLDAVMTHERAHARRRDPLVQSVALLNRAVFWFHPLAWWIERRLSALAEEACDSIVIERGHDPRDYAEYLLELARVVQRAGVRVNVTGMAMPGSHLPHRIRKMIGGAVPRVSPARMTCAAIACVICSAVFTAGTLEHVAQAQTRRPTEQFEVASVKPSAPIPPNGGVYFGPPRGGPGTPDPGLITWTYARLRDLLMTAYDMKTYQVNGPDWLNTERYDIVARVPAGATKEQVNAMWQGLLAERFGVVLHHESREFQVNELIIDKDGSKLRATTWDPASPLPPGAPQFDTDGGLASPGQVVRIFPRENGASFHTVARAQPISRLTALLGNALNRPVLDKTGLAGQYDYSIDYIMDQAALPPPPSGSGPGPGAAPANAGEPGPDIASAIRQQLGLRLVPGKAMIDVLIVDKAEKVPTAN